MSHDALDLPQITHADARLTWRDWALGSTAALALYSTGVAWQAQVVSYPLFGEVSAEEFPAYHLTYNAAIPLVVIVPGFLGFFASVALPWTRPADVSPRLAALVSATGLGAILSTLLWAIPMHDRLDRIGQDAATLDSLLQANAVRTGLLTLGAGALVWALVRRRRLLP
jgi:hypothetical protein